MDRPHVVKWKAGVITIHATSMEEIRNSAMKYIDIHKESFFSITPEKKLRAGEDLIGEEMEAAK